jgi:hypothetical protein
MTYMADLEGEIEIATFRAELSGGAGRLRTISQAVGP